MNLKKLNIFLLFYISALTLTALFNFICDPYNIFKNKRKIFISPQIIDFPYIPIKLHKNYKYNYVSPGGSAGKNLGLDDFNDEIANISLEYMSIENMEKYLFNFLDMHPETKIALLQLDFFIIKKENENNIAKFTGNSLNLKEIHKIFLGLSTTKYSFEQIFNKKRQKKYTIYTKGPIQSNIPEKEEYIEKGKNFYYEIIKNLKKRNIDVKIYTIPISVYAQLDFYNQHNDAIFQLKKYIVEQTGSLIDFAIINKLTSTNLNKGYYLYIDSIHPIKTLGYYVYAALFDTPDKDEDLYVILTKENVDFELKKQKQELLKWRDKHKKEYEDYLNTEKEPRFITKTIDEFPSEYREIMNNEN